MKRNNDLQKPSKLGVTGSNPVGRAGFSGVSSPSADNWAEQSGTIGHSATHESHNPGHSDFMTAPILAEIDRLNGQVPA